MRLRHDGPGQCNSQWTVQTSSRGCTGTIALLVADPIVRTGVLIAPTLVAGASSPAMPPTGRLSACVIQAWWSARRRAGSACGGLPVTHPQSCCTPRQLSPDHHVFSDSRPFCTTYERPDGKETGVRDMLLPGMPRRMAIGESLFGVVIATEVAPPSSTSISSAGSPFGYARTVATSREISRSSRKGGNAKTSSMPGTIHTAQRRSVSSLGATRKTRSQNGYSFTGSVRYAPTR
mmetsp:Transcript_9259/g.24224  ORF Transcript_9259/g.24224 Transcript_9259/m.24224 type:complete len:234 (-) Transcript_9259:237-938(-)